MLRPFICGVLWLFLSAMTATAQSMAPSSDRMIATPAFATDDGPLVLIDQAHNNFHTAGGRFRPFADLLRADGYRVDSLTVELSRASLRRGDILVISNALHASDVGDWSRPNPSAFSPEEIHAVVEWVSGGGSLLLIADHMPFPGAADMLAGAFGFRFVNGFAFQRPRRGIFDFSRADGRLNDHAITNGGVRMPDGYTTKRIETVRTFTGQGFRVPEDAAPLLVFDSTFVSLNPLRAWQFDDETPTVELDGLAQGAVLRFGCGRVAVFGEAAAFSAQWAGPDADIPVGMNAPGAEQNAAFVRNVMLWLSGVLG